MRNPVRKILGVALIGLLAAFVAAPAIAGAQTVDPIPGAGIGDCTFNVTPTTVNNFPASNVIVHVKAPANVTVQVFAQSITQYPQATKVAEADSGSNGNVNIPVPTITEQTTFTVNYLYNGTGEAAGNSYVAGCSTVAGEVVQRVSVEIAPAEAARALAFTGSNNTPTYVLIGIAAVVVGLVLVLAARRRSRVHG